MTSDERIPRTIPTPIETVITLARGRNELARLEFF